MIPIFSGTMPKLNSPKLSAFKFTFDKNNVHYLHTLWESNLWWIIWVGVQYHVVEKKNAFSKWRFLVNHVFLKLSINHNLQKSIKISLRWGILFLVSNQMNFNLYFNFLFLLLFLLKLWLFMFFYNY